MVENIKGGKVDPARADIKLHFRYLIDDPLRELWSCTQAFTGMCTDVEM
jgi:hypothetical protein